jgi:hypothetical protein
MGSTSGGMQNRYLIHFEAMKVSLEASGNMQDSSLKVRFDPLARDET